jgi:hypothetical protein
VRRVDNPAACELIFFIAETRTQAGIMFDVTSVAISDQHLHSGRRHANPVFKRTAFFWNANIHSFTSPDWTCLLKIPAFTLAPDRRA